MVDVLNFFNFLFANLVVFKLFEGVGDKVKSVSFVMVDGAFDNFECMVVDVC